MTIREAITHLQGTLCPYKVRCNSEVTEKDNEAFDTLWNSIEKAERYRWHDLRENPQDLPGISGRYEIVYKFGDSTGREFEHYTIFDGFHTPTEYPCIAWREIEPFESEERDEKV